MMKRTLLLTLCIHPLTCFGLTDLSWPSANLGVLAVKGEKDDGSVSWNYRPEFSTHVYYPLGVVTARASLRYAFDFSQSEGGGSYRVERDAMQFGGSLGAFYEGPFLFSADLGAVTVVETRSVVTEAPVELESQAVNHSYSYVASTLQFGVGFPMIGGSLVFEPFVRFESLEDEDNSLQLFGAELSFLFW